MKTNKQIKTKINKGVYAYMFDWAGFTEPSELKNKKAKHYAQLLENLASTKNLIQFSRNELTVWAKQIENDTVYEIYAPVIDDCGLTITLIPFELAEKLVSLNVMSDDDIVEKSIVLHDDANLCFVDPYENEFIDLPNKTVICDTDSEFAGMFFDVQLTDESTLASFFNVPYTEFETAK